MGVDAAVSTAGWLPLLILLGLLAAVGVAFMIGRRGTAPGTGNSGGRAEPSRGLAPIRERSSQVVPRAIGWDEVQAEVRSDAHTVPGLSEDALRILALISTAAIVVDADGEEVLYASSKAKAMGLVNSVGDVHSALEPLVEQASEQNVVLERDLSVIGDPVGVDYDLRVRVAAIGDEAVLVLADDVSSAVRLDRVRRDFVANVSHELKTPVGALSLLSEALDAAASDPEQVRRFAGLMHSEAARLNRLVGDLIDLSRLEGSQQPAAVQPLAVAGLAAEAVESIRTSAESKSIGLEVEVPESLTVQGVRDQLLAALRNLLANAVAYSPPETVVRIKAEQSQGLVLISVVDQGIGIPPEELDRVFERFYRIDRARSRETGGTGLGLAIVKHVANNHSGDVVVRSREGRGSTFTLRLPVHLGAPVRAVPWAEPIPEPAVAPSPGGGTDPGATGRAPGSTGEAIAR